MTALIRRTSEDNGLRSSTVEETMSEIQEQLNQLALREEGTEWVVDLRSRRIVRRIAGSQRQR